MIQEMRAAGLTMMAIAIEVGMAITVFVLPLSFMYWGHP